MTPQDKSKPVPLAVKVHPKVLTLVQDLAAYLNDSSLDHAVSEAIQEAGKDADFRQWRDAKAAHPIGQGSTATGKAKRASSDAHRSEGAPKHASKLPDCASESIGCVVGCARRNESHSGQVRSMPADYR